jgi:hypothetical protein
MIMKLIMKWIGVLFFSLLGVYDLVNGIAAYRRHDTWAIVSWKISMTPPAAILAGVLILPFVACFLVASAKNSVEKRDHRESWEP